MKINNTRYLKKPTKGNLKPKNGKEKWYISVFIFLLLGSGGVYTRAALSKPLPLIRADNNTTSFPATKQPLIHWPEGVFAALGTTYSGVLGTSSANEEPQSVASIAKVITALAVIQKKPISSTNDNIITFNANDEALYRHYASSDASNIPIYSGDQLSEYHALEAMLLPSANNIADSLALWAFGSMEAYTVYANDMIKSYGLQKTTVEEASGFNDTVLSTPSDLVVLGQKLLANTWLAQIVSLQRDNLPVLGKIYNTNQLLGDSINGIKTGHTNAAGFCLLLEKDLYLDKTHSIKIISAVMGASTAADSFALSESLVSSVQDNFGIKLLATKGTAFGTVKTPWGARSDIVSSVDINTYGLKSSARTSVTQPASISSTATAGTPAGTITTKNDMGNFDTYGLILKDSLKPPSAWWRLTHYF